MNEEMRDLIIFTIFAIISIAISIHIINVEKKYTMLENHLNILANYDKSLSGDVLELTKKFKELNYEVSVLTDLQRQMK